MPFVLAAARSMVSTPAPARMMSESCWAASIVLAVTFVERTTRTPTSATAPGRLSAFRSLRTSTVQAQFLKFGDGFGGEFVYNQDFHGLILLVVGGLFIEGQIIMHNSREPTARGMCGRSRLPSGSC